MASPSPAVAADGPPLPGISPPSACDNTRVCSSDMWFVGNATAVFWYGPFFTVAQPQPQTFAITLYRVNDPVAEAANVAPTTMGAQSDQCNPIAASIVHTWTIDLNRSDPDIIDAFRVWPDSGGCYLMLLFRLNRWLLWLDSFHQLLGSLWLSLLGLGNVCFNLPLKDSLL
ncbi:hypothetical protein BC829DRAFT_302211 [Chytridium lagenaria]|nr:hypothetical protein BC829DRAFT_302211 [Chytridium lagenaria]